MKISYVTTDLELDSENDLSGLVDELGDEVGVHLNDWVGNVYHVAVGLSLDHERPAEAVEFYCSLLTQLSPVAVAALDGCSRRTCDIAFESGTEPICMSYDLSSEIIRRLSELGIGVAVTIYEVGAYSDNFGDGGSRG